MHPPQRKLPSQGAAISSQTVPGFVSPQPTRNPFPGSFDELLDGAVKQHSEGERLPGLKETLCFPRRQGVSSKQGLPSGTSYIHKNLE